MATSASGQRIGTAAIPTSPLAIRTDPRQAPGASFGVGAGARTRVASGVLHGTRSRPRTVTARLAFASPQTHSRPVQPEARRLKPEIAYTYDRVPEQHDRRRPGWELRYRSGHGISRSGRRRPRRRHGPVRRTACVGKAGAWR